MAKKTNKNEVTKVPGKETVKDVVVTKETTPDGVEVTKIQTFTTPKGSVTLPNGDGYVVDTKTMEQKSLQDLIIMHYRVAELIRGLKGPNYNYNGEKFDPDEAKLYKVVDNDKYEIWMDETSTLSIGTPNDSSEFSPWYGDDPQPVWKPKTQIVVYKSRVKAQNITSTPESQPYQSLNLFVNIEADVRQFSSSVIVASDEGSTFKAQNMKNSYVSARYGVMEVDYLTDATLKNCTGVLKGSVNYSELTDSYIRTSNYSSLNNVRMQNCHFSVQALNVGGQPDASRFHRLAMKDLTIYEDGESIDIQKPYEIGKTGAGLGRYEITFYPIRVNGKTVMRLSSMANSEEYETPSTHIDFKANKMEIRNKVTAILFPKERKVPDEDGLRGPVMRSTIEASIIDEAVGVLHGRLAIINQSRLIASI
ncbi:hypothetical protein [Vibrio phage phiKT1028]|nr:hypothetical protein [Vibrio phage phiKT1028]